MNMRKGDLKGVPWLGMQAQVRALERASQRRRSLNCSGSRVKRQSEATGHLALGEQPVQGATTERSVVAQGPWRMEQGRSSVLVLVHKSTSTGVSLGRAGPPHTQASQAR